MWISSCRAGLKKKTLLILKKEKTESETRGRNGWVVMLVEAKREQWEYWYKNTGEVKLQLFPLNWPNKWLEKNKCEPNVADPQIHGHGSTFVCSVIILKSKVSILRLECVLLNTSQRKEKRLVGALGQRTMIAEKSGSQDCPEPCAARGGCFSLSVQYSLKIRKDLPHHTYTNRTSNL